MTYGEDNTQTIARIGKRCIYLKFWQKKIFLCGYALNFDGYLYRNPHFGEFNEQKMNDAIKWLRETNDYENKKSEPVSQEYLMLLET